MRLDLRTLNSATKYPSIPTYHALGDRGALTDATVAFPDGPVLLTEKVDGTNGRIVLLPDGDWFIGSREELLHAKGDRVSNPALGIVDALRPLAERLVPRGVAGITVFFLEVYGHRIGAAAKQYTADGNVGQRVFDVAEVPLETLEWERGQIAAWRDGGGQRWLPEEEFRRFAAAEGIEVTPRVASVDASGLPTGVEESAHSSSASERIEQVSRSPAGPPCLAWWS